MTIKRYYRLIPLLLSATTLVSCTKAEERLKVSEIKTALASNEALTFVDEKLNQLKVEKNIASDEKTGVEGLQFVSSSYPFTIEDLEKELMKKEIVCDIGKCNDMLKTTIGEILKTEVAEYLGVENEELVGFDVTGTRYYTKGLDSSRVAFYTVDFTYKDKRYKFFANNNEAYRLCYRYRACEKGELDYYGIHDCYNFIKGALLCDAELSNNPKTVEGHNFEGETVIYEFDGIIDLKQNKYKKNAVKTYKFTRK